MLSQDRNPMSISYTQYDFVVYSEQKHSRRRRRGVMQSLLVRNMLIYLSLSLGIVLATTDNTWPQDNEIIIHNRAHKGPLGFANKTDFDGGPVVGDILNYHYFPGLQDYKNGNYVGAARQMDYIMRNHRFILDINPRKKEYVSTAYYLH